MQSQAQRLISLFRTIVPAGVSALLITSAVLPMPAQNSVPPTAVQAASMPQFASRLAHPANQPASRPNPAPARQMSRRGPGQDQTIYENGPINGNTDAWPINLGFVTSDTFYIPLFPTSVTGMTFGAWLFPGDTLDVRRAFHHFAPQRRLHLLQSDGKFDAVKLHRQRLRLQRLHGDGQLPESGAPA